MGDPTSRRPIRTQCLKRGTISYFPELVSFTCFHYLRVKYEYFGVKWGWELFFSEFTVILRKKGLKKEVFFKNISYFSKMWFLVLSISNMKYIQSITYKLVGESKNNHKKYSECIFFIWFSSEICLKKGYFLGKWLVPARSQENLSYIAQNIQDRSH